MKNRSWLQILVHSYLAHEETKLILMVNMFHDFEMSAGLGLHI